MRLSYLLFFLFAATLLAACGADKNNFTVAGNIANMPRQIIYLEELSVNNNIKVIDSSTSDEKGYFEMGGRLEEAGLYRLRFQGNQFVILSLEKGTTKVVADWNTLTDCKVAGSPASASLHGFLAQIRASLRDYNTLSVVMDSMQARGNDSLLAKAKADMDEMNFNLTHYVENYADTTKYLPNALFAVQMLNPASEGDYLTVFSQSIAARFPNSKLAKDYIAKAEQITTENTAAAVKDKAIGMEAPEIDLPSPEGKSISLSSLKGKYVLIDFWASWCGPCRAENPNVVAAYSKFRNKNFTILGVSLDSDKAKWMKAIEDDNLTWNHISDLQGWESLAARDYNVQSIPMNFLVDPQGKIVATNLRGAGLEAALKQSLK